MKDTQIQIRVSDELKEKAKQLAEEDMRSLSNFIELLIRQEYERRHPEAN